MRERDGCITCGDVAVWLRVTDLQAEQGLARCVDAEGRAETVAVDLVAPVGAGAMVLVHAGTALQKRASAPQAGEAR